MTDVFGEGSDIMAAASDHVDVTVILASISYALASRVTESLCVRFICGVRRSRRPRRLYPQYGQNLLSWRETLRLDRLQGRVVESVVARPK